MKSILNNFNKLVAGLIIILSATFVFASGGSTLMALRDYDAGIGLLTRPDKTFSGLAKFFKPLEVEAQCSIGPCATEPSLREYITKFDIENVLNRTLRTLVLNFVKGLVDFLKQQFDNLLSVVQDWSSTVLGLRLNTSHIKRFVAMQAYTQFNLVEGEVNKIFDDIFGPLEETKNKEALNQAKNLASQAVATFELSTAIEKSGEGNPGQTNTSPVPDTKTFKTDILDSVEGMLQENCKVTQLAVKPSNSPLEDAILVSKGVMNRQCLGITSGFNEVGFKIDQRQESIKKMVEVATMADNLNLGETDTCGVGIFSTDSLSDANNKFDVSFSSNFNASDYGYKSTSDFSNPVVASAFAVTEGKSVFGLGRSECELANEAKQNAQALAEANNSKSAPQTENLTDVFFETLKDFATQIFDSLVNILTKFIDQALEQITNAISNISLREISSPLSKAFGDFKGGVNKGLKDLIKDARVEVEKGIDDLQYGLESKE